MKPPDIRYEEREKRDGSVALCHPETGEEFGRVAAKNNGWWVWVPTPGVGLLLWPELFPTRHAARMFILERHRPEAS